LAWAFRANRSLGLAKPAPILSRHWFKPACVSRNIELGSPWTAARSPSATLRGETGFCKIYQGKSGRWAPALEKWRKSSKPEKAEVLLVRWRGCILAAICRAPGKSQSKTKWRIGDEKDALDCVGHVLAGGIVDARDGMAQSAFDGTWKFGEVSLCAGGPFFRANPTIHVVQGKQAPVRPAKKGYPGRF
jgi:hypothetical protein